MRGTRRVPLPEFLKGPRHTARQPDELLVAVILPSHALSGQGHFLKLGARSYLVISIAMVAVRLQAEDDVIREASVSVGACSPVATRLPELEASLMGQQVADLCFDDALVTRHLSPIADARANAAYRMSAACELVRRCLQGAVDLKVAA